MKICKTLLEHVLDEDHSSQNSNMFWMKIGQKFNLSAKLVSTMALALHKTSCFG
jgi:hypothetical protein